MLKNNKKLLVFILVAVFLFIIPFFWLKPGEMDLGGDSHRLYFYNPLANLKAQAIYSVVPWGIAHVSYNQYFIPYILLLSSIKFFFNSPTTLISIFNGLKLAGSFVFIFLIIKEFLKNKDFKSLTLAEYWGAAIGALFYTFSSSVLDNMKHALVTHDMVFLNPMVFYLILRYLKTLSFKYIYAALFLTFIFSSSFVLYNPPLYAFYPLAFSFIFLYNYFILEKKIPWKGIIVGALFFLGLHAFHIIPVLINIFDKGSEINTRAFESLSESNVGLEYFSAIVPFSKLSLNILMPLENLRMGWSLILIPLLMTLGFLAIRRKDKSILILISIFFFIALFLKSANITNIGVEFYKLLFYIPGFGMFRNFAGQWQFVYTFFYSLLAGLLIASLFSALKKKYIYIISILAIGLLAGRSTAVFNGDLVNVIQRGSKEMGVVIRMDPNYERMLNYIKNIPNDGRVFHVPFTDFAYNLVGGLNNGVYVGQSMVSLLSGRNDFAGYQHIDPFSESFRDLVLKKDYPLIKKMLMLLQVRYVLYNSDPKISDTYFPDFPYKYTNVPASPTAALEFAENISSRKVFQSGYYSLFEVDKENYLPHFYIPSKVLVYDVKPEYNKQYFGSLSFFNSEKLDNIQDKRIAFVESSTCHYIFSEESCSKNEFGTNDDVEITYQKINPTKYKIKVKNGGEPFLLVFQDKYSPYWKLYSADLALNIENVSDNYFDDKIVELEPYKKFIDKKPFETNTLKSIYEKTHIEVNGYANAWYIDSQDEEIEIIAENLSQKIFYYTALVSLISLVLFILYGIKLLKNK